VGIRDTEAAGIFDEFTQADASTTRRFGGTGLGLAISREIVDALGGQTGLEPNPSGGSLFWFTASFDPPSGAIVDPEDEHARTWLAGRRVLVVDDNETNRLILQEQLGWWQVRSLAVPSADAALAALAAAVDEGDPFDAALLDLVMPEQDGLDLAEAVRRETAYDGLVLLMLTSRTAPDPARVGRAGVAAELAKPVLAGVLRDALLRHLAGVGSRPAGEADPVARDTERRHRVLVVEDNPLNQMVATGLLGSLGYLTGTAEDGVEAVEAMARGGYDAVLMDVQMPRMDGYAATREIRAQEERGHRVPVIAMTAAAVEGERERCLAAGMDDFLTKPVDPAALRSVLGRWLAGSTDEEQIVTEPTPRQDPIGDLDLDRLDELRDLDPGDTTYLDRAIGNFVANTPTTLATIRDACDSGDAEALKMVSHKLAGGALNLGVTPAGRIAQQIELVADTGSTQGAAELVDELEKALEAGRTAILAYQASYSGVAGRV
jgi:CheY-like chemotaxis protein